MSRHTKRRSSRCPHFEIKALGKTACLAILFFLSLTALGAVVLCLSVQLHLPRRCYKSGVSHSGRRRSAPAPQTWLGVETPRPPVYSSATLPPGTALGPDPQGQGLSGGQDPPLVSVRPPFVPGLGSLPRHQQWRSVARRPAPLGPKQLPALTRSAAGVNFQAQDKKEDL